MSDTLDLLGQRMSLDTVIATKHSGVKRVKVATKILTPTELD